MKNFEFLQKYYSLQKDIMFDKLIDTNFGIIAYSEIDKSEFWNNILIDNILKNTEIDFLEKEFGELKRKPAVYFENKEKLFQLKKDLIGRNYKEGWEDSWMFWQDKNIDTSRFSEVKKVTNDKELKIFLEIFDKSFQEDDPQNPYGELGDYLIVTEKNWYKHNKTNKIEYFVVYKDDKPVAVSSLTNYDGIGYISNVGSLKEFRGGGYGKLATLYCVEQSKINGNNEHCLATEEKTYPNEFYKRIGFDTRFTAIGYIKNK